MLQTASYKLHSAKQLEICNFSPTRFYLNYDHHSVTKLHKMMKDPNFSKHKFATTKKPIQLLSIDEIKKLTMDFDKEEVLYKATLKLVEQTNNWKMNICTTCYIETELQQSNHFCRKCNRFVAEPLKRSNLNYSNNILNLDAN
ncbi:hypothetical protein POM88_015929 [Heracleum sosnowskyi]|uniref:Uncharacterized protein n=1 Tax=Heracleum sosnowskyi TaxID=360622 RepID=A0AAD8MWB3_9APIA|nr:hypothetical protein POM88_015929 [Heracleum sosnowskyi]